MVELGCRTRGHQCGALSVPYLRVVMVEPAGAVSYWQGQIDFQYPICGS